MAAGCAMFGISVWLHRGFVRFLIACAVGGALLLGLAMGQGRLYDLPLSVQRTISSIPGEWDPVVLSDAETSTEARFQWWVNIVKYDVIKNWWVGDGFGASVQDVALAFEQKEGFGALEVGGSFHNGPLTTIRYVGLAGLFLFYVLAITSAVQACHCVRKCKGTLLQPVALFLAMQLVWFPIHFTLIFGAYNVDMPQMIFLVALLRLVMRMADDIPGSRQQQDSDRRQLRWQ
jgi:hypothetical protein